METFRRTRLVLLSVLTSLTVGCGIPDYICGVNNPLKVDDMEFHMRHGACIWGDTIGGAKAFQSIEEIPREVFTETIFSVYPSEKKLQDDNPTLKRLKARCAYDAQRKVMYLVPYGEKHIADSCVPHELAHAWKFELGDHVNTHDEDFWEKDAILRKAATWDE